MTQPLCVFCTGCTGFGDEVEWLKLDEGLAAAKESNKLAMVVVHKSWCGACKRLGPSFAAEQRVKDLADNFVMINVHDDGACNDSQPPSVGTRVQYARAAMQRSQPTRSTSRTAGISLASCSSRRMAKS